MLKAQFFHANAIDKMSKVDEQMNAFLGKIDQDSVVSVNTTELGYAGIQQFYSYTVLVIYKAAG